VVEIGRERATGGAGVEDMVVDTVVGTVEEMEEVKEDGKAMVPGGLEQLLPSLC